MIEAILVAAHRWHAARAAFLALPPGAPEARARLNDLAEAEDALFRATQSRPAEWRPHADGFVCGDVGVFPVIPDAGAVWDHFSGEWSESEPFTAAGKSGRTFTAGANPPYEFWERSTEETIEAAKRLAIDWLNKRQASA